MRAGIIVLVLALLASGCARTYSAQGLVVGVQPRDAQIVISHEAIPGLMEPMVMPFALRASAGRTKTAPGDRVRFRLVVRRGRSYVDRLTVLSADRRDAGLQRSPAASTLTAIGSMLPDFELTDHEGLRFHLASTRGRVVAVNFIYTRCPLPDYCPRLIADFRAVRERFAARIGRDLVLLTISFDPRYDSPAVLRAYADALGAGGDGWRLLTGASDEIRQVCEAFGIEYWADEGLITHTLQTAVIDRDGRLAAAIEGRQYSAAQLGDVIAGVLETRVTSLP